MKRVLKLLDDFTTVVEKTPGLPLNVWPRGKDLLSRQVATQKEKNLIK